MEGVPYGYGEVSQTREMPLFAGPLRIPPENFQLRVRRETDAADTINARLVEEWAAAVPRQQDEYVRVDIPGLGIATKTTARPRTREEASLIAAFPRGEVGLPEMREALRAAGNSVPQAIAALEARIAADGRVGRSLRDSTVPRTLQPTYEDMLPVSSRTDARDFRQSRPYDPTGDALALNPYFDRYDPTRDPRNAVREVRSVVYELKEPDRGLEGSERLRVRTFQNRDVPEGETPTRLTQAHELLRPKIDNPEVVYRGQTQSLWKYGSPL